MIEANANIDPLVIGGKRLQSRFFLGTGRFPSPAVLQLALEASKAEVVTFAVRRVNLDDAREDSILQHMQERELTYLPNTSGANNADEAVRIARLARAAGLGTWIKVEISANPRTLLPDPLETLRATERLAAEGFVVLPYTSDDPVLCKRLEEAGAAAVMPGGAPIGSGLGILNPYNIGLIAQESRVPIIVDAGIGSAGDVVQAMELGADGILVNTPVAKALDPVGMAQAMRLAVEAGRLSYLSGRIPRRQYASASSEAEGVSKPALSLDTDNNGNSARDVKLDAAIAAQGENAAREAAVALASDIRQHAAEAADAGKELGGIG
ncbi:thiazole synthase [Paenibacillus methanolicus]|uniref:Thiazole synthase n=1 Tax=Paenibacillus methanolicus TaxID=582686 RepID=A0A5S5BW48_9BACL|nr:thiazole synthase [Paenibacillus methanolicus]